MMPFLVKALLDNRSRYEQGLQDDEKKSGYLRPREGYRLFEHAGTAAGSVLTDGRSRQQGMAVSTR